MSIDFEQVSALVAGDFIRLEGPGDVTIQGRLTSTPEGSRGLSLGPGLQVRRSFDGYPAQNWIDGRFNLHVVEKAKPPLYVNHPRTEPVPGDVVRDADSNDPCTWLVTSAEDDADDERWVSAVNAEAGYVRYATRANLPDRLRLLVDGETGQVVQ